MLEKVGEKGNERSLPTQPLLPAAQAELDQKIQQCMRAAYHAEAFGCMELIARGMKLQAIRAADENPELLKLKGFNKLEDLFESLGISRQTGFNLKKIAKAFSDEEVQSLYSMGFSQRGVLKLAALPHDMLPAITDTDDPQELKSQIEDLLADLGTKEKAHAKEVQGLCKQIDGDKHDMIAMKKRLDAFERIYPEDDRYWVIGNRPIHSHMWEGCLNEIKAFALNDRAVNNTDALQYLRELYARIVGNLIDLNEEFKEKNAGRSFVRPE